MKRIAFFGPLNPIPSGISDYDEELLPLLRQHYKVDVYLNGPVGGNRVHQHHEFYLRNKANPYDLTVYQIGNSLLHETMYGYLFRYPGAVVLHDYCLHHARAKMLLMKGFINEYLDEAKYAYPEEARLGKAVFGGIASNLLFYYYPFVKLVIESSLSAGAHSDWVVDQLKPFGTPVIKIPMAVDVTPRVSETQSVAELQPDNILLASFGFVTPEKRISRVLAVLHELRYFYPGLRYVIVGEVADYFDLESEIRHLGLQEVVTITGRVKREQFHEWMRRSDIVINLRHPSARETSATLLRAMAMGKPVLISRLLHLQEIPAEAVMRVRPDREQEDLFHNLWQLIEDCSLRERIGRAALQYIETNHRPGQMVEKYRELIETALERKQTYQPPDLPVHLRSGNEIMREYIKKTMFCGKDSELINWIL
jgi:glycosyltransferase involved in cell wall biosynthesis